MRAVTRDALVEVEAAIRDACARTVIPDVTVDVVEEAPPLADGEAGAVGPARRPRAGHRRRPGLRAPATPRPAARRTPTRPPGMGVPSIDGLGPIGGLDHAPGEYLEVASIVPRTALLAALIVAIGRDPEVRGLARRAGDRARPDRMTRTRVTSGGPWEAIGGYSRAIAVGDACFVSGTTDAGPTGASLPSGRRRRPGARDVRDHRAGAHRGRLRARGRRADADVHRRSGGRRRGRRGPRRGLRATSARRRRWWSSPG